MAMKKKIKKYVRGNQSNHWLSSWLPPCEVDAESKINYWKYITENKLLKRHYWNTSVIIRIWLAGICKGRKVGEPRDKLLEQGQEPTTNSTRKLCQARIKPGPHWREASTLTVAPSLLSTNKNSKETASRN